MLNEITRDEWVRYHWIDVTQMRDTERRFLRARERTPEEATAASRELADVSTDLSRRFTKATGWRRWFGLS